jgi:hypothetical protein
MRSRTPGPFLFVEPPNKPLSMESSSGEQPTPGSLISQQRVVAGGSYSQSRSSPSSESNHLDHECRKHAIGAQGPSATFGWMRRYVWIKDDPAGMEQAELSIGTDGMDATSVAFGSVPVPYRLDLSLTVDAHWVTRRLALSATGDGWTRSLVLQRDAAARWTGSWSADGSEPAAVAASVPQGTVEPAAIPAEVLDVDVQWSPVTNLMPVRRLGLDRAGSTGTFTMAWVSVPSLAVTLDEQHYTLLGVDDGDVCARFENGDGFFTVVIRCDADGVALDYPGIARRVL